MPGIPRPDRSRLIVDCLPEDVTITEDNGKITTWKAAQVWIDPARPNAHEHPAFRAFVERLATRDVLVIIRRDVEDGFILFPPSLGAGEWRQIKRTNPHIFTREHREIPQNAR